MYALIQQWRRNELFYKGPYVSLLSLHISYLLKCPLDVFSVISLLHGSQVALTICCLRRNTHERVEEFEH